MRPAIAIIRAQPGADETAGQIRAAGIKSEIVISPLLEVEPLPLPDIPTPAQLVFTSPNGAARAASLAQTQAHNPVWCVGERTAAQAKKAGFQTIKTGAGNGRDLARFIIAENTNDAPFFHLGNKAASDELVDYLNAHQLRATRYATYWTKPADAFTSELTARLNTSASLILMLHSKAAATRFSALCPPNAWENLHVVAISHQAVSGLENSVPLIKIANAPNSAAIMVELHNLLAEFE